MYDIVLCKLDAFESTVHPFYILPNLCSGEISSELCQSVKMNHQYKVKVLLDLPGININFKKNGKVPLMHIQWSDRLLEDCMQIEELLLSRNANIDAVDDQGVAAR